MHIACYFFLNSKYIINNKSGLCTIGTKPGKRETAEQRHRI
jgi:hypothetical protein